VIKIHILENETDSIFVYVQNSIKQSWKIFDLGCFMQWELMLALQLGRLWHWCEWCLWFWLTLSNVRTSCMPSMFV